MATGLMARKEPLQHAWHHAQLLVLVITDPDLYVAARQQREHRPVVLTMMAHRDFVAYANWDGKGSTATKTFRNVQTLNLRLVADQPTKSATTTRAFKRIRTPSSHHYRVTSPTG